VETNRLGTRIVEFIKTWKRETTLILGAMLVIYGLLLLLQGNLDSQYYTWWFLLPVAAGLTIMTLAEFFGKK